MTANPTADATTSPSHVAGLGSVIIDSQPLTVAVLAALLFGENLSALGVVGLVLGVLGLGLLEVPEEVLVQGPAALVASAGAGGSVFQSGEFYMLLAAQSMALGTVMVRWVAGWQHVVQVSDLVLCIGFVLGWSMHLCSVAHHGSGRQLPCMLVRPSMHSWWRSGLARLR